MCTCTRQGTCMEVQELAGAGPLLPLCGSSGMMANALSHWVLWLAPWVVFLRQVLRCSHGWPETCYVDQAGLEFTDICLLLLLNAVIKGMGHHAQPLMIFKTEKAKLILHQIYEKCICSVNAYSKYIYLISLNCVITEFF